MEWRIGIGIGYDDISYQVLLCCVVEYVARVIIMRSSSSHEVEVVDSSLVGRSALWPEFKTGGDCSHVRTS
jgi:hypothetical protein